MILIRFGFQGIGKKRGNLFDEGTIDVLEIRFLFITIFVFPRETINEFYKFLLSSTKDEYIIKNSRLFKILGNKLRIESTERAYKESEEKYGSELNKLRNELNSLRINYDRIEERNLELKTTIKTLLRMKEEDEIQEAEQDSKRN